MGDFSAGFLSITNGRKLLYFSYSFVNLTPSGRTAPYRSRFCFHDVGAMLPEKDMCFRSWWGPRKHIRVKVIQILRQASHDQKGFAGVAFKPCLGPIRLFVWRDMKMFSAFFGVRFQRQGRISCQILATGTDFVSDPGNEGRFCVRSWQRGQILCQILATRTDDPGNEDRFCVRSWQRGQILCQILTGSNSK